MAAAPSNTGVSITLPGKTGTLTASNFLDPSTLTGVPLLTGKDAAALSVDYQPFIDQINKIASAPAPKLTVPGIDYAGINTAAGKMAATDIAGQVAGYQGLQKNIVDQGSAEQALMNRLGLAAYKQTEPWAAGIKQGYLQSAQGLGQLAQGFTGDLATTAQDENAKLVSQLQGLGSAQRPDTAQAPALANVAYGLGAALPGDTLMRQGTAAYAAAKAAPAAFEDYMRQQGLGVYGAAQQSARQYDPEIAKAIASKPALTTQYATSLLGQATGQRDFEYKVQQDLYSRWQDTQKTQLGVIGQLAGFAGKQASSNLGIYNANAKSIGQNNQLQLAVAKYMSGNEDRQNKLVQFGANLSATFARIHEMVTHNRITEAQGQARIKQAADNYNLNVNKFNHQQDVDMSNAFYAGIRAQNATDNSRHWYQDNVSGRPVAQAGYKLKILPTGEVTAVRDPSQWGTGKKAGALSAAGAAKAYKSAAQAAADGFSGVLPKYQGIGRGRMGIPGWNGTTVTNSSDFFGAGGKVQKHYWEIVQDVVQASGGLYTPKQARKFVDQQFRNAGLDPAQAARYNWDKDNNQWGNVFKAGAQTATDLSGALTTAAQGPFTTTTQAAGGSTPPLYQQTTPGSRGLIANG